MISASKESILENMRAGVSYKKQIKIRGLKLLIRPLSIGEQRSVTNEVAERLSKQPIHIQNKITEEIEFAKLTIQQATSSAPDKVDFTLSEHLLEDFTVAEVLTALKEYNQFCKDVDPSLDELPKEELDALVDLVKKNPSQLTELSISELRAVSRSLLQTAISTT